MNNDNQLLKSIQTEEFDYIRLLDCLKAYKNPRSKITKLLETKAIIRIKKGLYIKGVEYRGHAFSKAILANLIYGPSYISLEYALSRYGLIPERVDALTSITPKQKKEFSTPVGLFTYYHLPLDKYQSSSTLYLVDKDRYCLMAIPEKAIIDTVWKNRVTLSPHQLKDHLLYDLRINAHEFNKLDYTIMKSFTTVYHSKLINRLCDLIGVL